MTKYILPVQYDTATHDHYIQFPDEVLKEVGWKIGDTLVWHDNKDGSFVLSNKEEDMEGRLQPVVYKFVSTKEFVDAFPCAYRQWKADSHCNMIHGYSFSMRFWFGSNDLDIRNWVADYGGFKELKEVLQDQFDHTLLVAQDDPEIAMFHELERKKLAKLTILPRLGCEGLADMLYKYINGVYIPDMWGPGEASRVWCFRVEVRETQANMAFREGHREWNEDLFEE